MREVFGFIISAAVFGLIICAAMEYVVHLLGEDKHYDDYGYQGTSKKMAGQEPVRHGSGDNV